jgi:hypothetical protein
MAGVNTQALDRFEGDIYSGSYFEPDIMLPEQFNSKDEDGIDGGERKLMAAVLSDGVEAFLDQASSYVKGYSSRLDAIEWVESSDNSYVFSFENVCSSLGISPDYLRLGLSRYLQAIKKSKMQSGDANKITPWKKIRRPRIK